MHHRINLPVTFDVCIGISQVKLIRCVGTFRKTPNMKPNTTFPANFLSMAMALVESFYNERFTRRFPALSSLWDLFNIERRFKLGPLNFLVLFCALGVYVWYMTLGIFVLTYACPFVQFLLCFVFISCIFCIFGTLSSDPSLFVLFSGLYYETLCKLNEGLLVYVASLLLSLTVSCLSLVSLVLVVVNHLTLSALFRIIFLGLLMGRGWLFFYVEVLLLVFWSLQVQELGISWFLFIGGMGFYVSCPFIVLFFTLLF